MNDSVPLLKRSSAVRAARPPPAISEPVAHLLAGRGVGEDADDRGRPSLLVGRTDHLGPHPNVLAHRRQELAREAGRRRGTRPGSRFVEQAVDHRGPFRELGGHVGDAAGEFFSGVGFHVHHSHGLPTVVRP
jgi:hypothetical protein